MSETGSHPRPGCRSDPPSERRAGRRRFRIVPQGPERAIATDCRGFDDARIIKPGDFLPQEPRRASSGGPSTSSLWCRSGALVDVIQGVAIASS